VRCLILIPLITREQITSILSVISYTPNSYSAKEVELVARFGQQVATAIANAQLYQQVQRYNLELEQRIADRTAELQAAQERLVRQEKLAVLGQLAGGVAHEVRNPLGVISNAVYFLQMVLPQADNIVKEYLQIISSRVQEAEKIVTDLLNFSRTQAADKESITLSELVAEALQRNPPPEQVRVINQLPPNLPSIVVDTRQMGQVLANLMTNAYQAMPEGGTLTLAARSEAHRLHLEIIDTGIGMPAEIRQKIFEPLFTTKAKGIGLGLVITKNLVELNGGTIEVESVEGQGSCFTLSLPAKEARS
jgi:signal transduction histidine kinase